ncbi:MAG: ATP-binding protein [Planctomycetota bacterium]|jgi:signal transduction histidine kinase/DNA-binding response OmpR family regulator
MKKELIMVVEDEVVTASSLQKCLEKFGYVVTAAITSGEQAILQMEKERPDLVIMDIGLEGEMDGIEAARIINTKFDIPVIYLTSHVEKTVFEKAKKTNMYGYITKPFNKEELEKVIDLGLQRHRIDVDRRMLVAELKKEIVERNRMERELEMRVRQQDVIAYLGHKALMGENPIEFMNELVNKVAETLDNEYCKILKLLPGGKDMLLLAGVGWEEGIVGQTKVHTGLGTQAGYTLNSNKPVIVEDLRTETRFTGHSLLHNHNVVSGLSIIIKGQDDPWGVLSTHSTKHTTISKDDVNFLHSVANLLASTMARKSSEEKLIEKTNEVEKINRELHDFVYTVSHDLKEPLFSVDGYVTQLYETYKGLYDEKGRQFSDRIKVNIDLMSNRIHEILEVVRIGMIPYDFKVNSSEEIIKNVLVTLENKLESNNINVQIKHNLPNIFCDENRIRDVFYNLVTNAIKFMGNDNKRQITIGCNKDIDYYKFSVEDSGIGIRKEYHKSIFKIFCRLKDLETEGTGIGLAIVKKIIETHKGTIWIESPVDNEKGTRFCFTIPITEL